MLIAIAADLHDNLANWKKFKEYAKKQGIKTLLFCGDLCNSETLNQITKDWDGKIFLIAGNQELYEQNKDKNMTNLNFLGRYGQIQIKNIKIGLIHEPYFQKKLENNGENLNYIFYGHTHKPWIEKKGDLIIANPGTLGGVFYKASFALLNIDTGAIELKILETI